MSGNFERKRAYLVTKTIKLTRQEVISAIGLYLYERDDVWVEDNDIELLCDGEFFGAEAKAKYVNRRLAIWFDLEGEKTE
jgi:hypothetical protein